MELLVEQINTISVLLSGISAAMMLFVAIESKNMAKRSAELQKEMYALQQKYNMALLCPKCDIVCSETGGIIKISLYNYGQGTMIIKHLDIINKDTESLLHNAYEIVPENIGISYYSLETKGRNISVGGHIKLIEIDLNKLNAKEYEKVRRTLAKYTITVYYAGVYEQDVEMEATKDLAKLFGNVYRKSSEKIKKKSIFRKGYR